MALLEGEMEKFLIPFVNFLNPEVSLICRNNGDLGFSTNLDEYFLQLGRFK